MTAVAMILFSGDAWGLVDICVNLVGGPRLWDATGGGGTTRACVASGARPPFRSLHVCIAPTHCVLVTVLIRGQGVCLTWEMHPELHIAGDFGGTGTGLNPRRGAD